MKKSYLQSQKKSFKSILVVKLFTVIVLLLPFELFGQTFTETFDTNPCGSHLCTATNFTRNLNGVDFEFTFQGSGDGGDFSYETENGEGNSPAINLLSGGANQGTTETVTIKRNDNGEFIFNSIFVNNTDAQTLTIQGYKNGSAVSSSESAPMGTNNTLSFGGITVDEVRITSTDFYNINLDSFSGEIPSSVTVPTVTTAAATSITATGATLSGTVTEDGGDAVTERGFLYATTTNPTISDTKIQIGDGTGTFSDEITGLDPETTYYVRAYAINGEGTSYGSEESFTTESAGVLLSTNPILTFTENSADITGDNIAMDGEGGSQSVSDIDIQVFNISDEGGTFINSLDWKGHGFLASGDPNYSGLTYDNNNEASKGMSVKSADGSKFRLIQFTYYNWGESNSFTNTIKGFRDGSEVASMTFDGFDSAYNPITVLLEATFSNVDEVRIYVSDAGWTGDGTSNHSINNIQVTSPVSAVPPSVATVAASSVTAIGATLSGNVTDDGGDTVTERGFVYATSTSPTTLDTKIQDGTGTGAFEEDITGLDPETTYYTRAYALNGEGTSYGSEESFTTPASTGSIIITSEASSPSGEWSLAGGILKPLADGTKVNLSEVQTALESGSLQIQAPIDVIIDADIANALSSEQDLTLKADRNVILNPGASLTATNFSLNMIFWSDADGDDDGVVWLNWDVSNGGTMVNTNGGDLWMGGGSGSTTWNSLSVGDGVARGNNDNANGITFIQSEIQTHGGNMAVYGKGGTNISVNIDAPGASSGTTISNTNNNGIRLLGGNSIDADGGKIYMYGYADDPSSNANGIELSQTSSGGSDLISSSNSADDAIVIEGYAENNSGASNSWGFYTHYSTVQNIGGGGIHIKGSGAKNSGVTVAGNGAVLANGGKIILEGTAAGGTNPNVLVQGAVGQKAGTDVISSGADIEIIGDRFSISGTAPNGRIQSSGVLAIRPYTASTDIGIGSAAGTLQLPASYFSTNFTDGFSGIIVGDENTGLITAEGTTVYNDPLTLKTNGSIVFAADADVSSASANALTLWTRARGNNEATDANYGTIWMPQGSSINTGGGDLTMGGGSDPSVGYAMGDNSAPAGENNARYRGVAMNGSIDAAGGTIIINGSGASNITHTRGVNIGGPVKTEGIGNITVRGVGRGSSDAIALGDSYFTPDAVGILEAESGNISLYGQPSGSTQNGLNVSTSGSYIKTNGSFSAVTTGRLTATAGALDIGGNTSLEAVDNITLTHASNDFDGSITVDGASNLQVTDQNELSLGDISVSGTIDIATLAGNLTITENISTTNATADAIQIFADKTKNAGDSSGGNIKISGTPAINTGAGGQARLYSGSRLESVDLISLTGEGNTRYEVDASTTVFSPVLGSGNYALIREVENFAPTDITLNATTVNQSDGANATIGTLSTTDADGGDSHTYSLVVGTGDDDNGSFNINGSELRAMDASTLTAGNHSVRIQTDDGTATYAKAFTITVVDDVAPTFANSTPSVSGTTSSQTTLTVQLDEVGTAYYVVVADGDDSPSSAQVKAGENSVGTATSFSGSITVSSALQDVTEDITGLSQSTAYDVYVVAEDGEGNLQGTPESRNVETLGPPVFTSTPTTEVDYGQLYSYPVIATQVGELITTITAQTLPDWLSLDADGESVASQVESEIQKDEMGMPQTIGATGDGKGNIYAITSDGTTVYYVEPDGSTRSITGLTSGTVYALFVSGNYLYIPRKNNSINSITRIPLDNPSAGEELFAAFTGGALSLAEKGDWIYSVNDSEREVKRIHKTSKTVETVLTSADGLPANGPYGIDFDSAGNLYIATNGNKSILKYDGNTVTTALSGMSSNPTAVRVDRSGNFYVSTSGDGIRKYASDWSYIENIAPGETGNIWSLSFSSSGALVYGDLTSQEIYKLQTGAILSGTPAKSDVGNHSVVLEASNSVGSTQQSFTFGVQDNKGPVADAFSPADQSTDISVQPTLSITFDEAVELGNEGTFVLKDGATSVQAYDLSNASDRDQFSLSGDSKTVTLSISNDLPLNTTLSVEIQNGDTDNFAEDIHGNAFAGFEATSNTWTFTTVANQAPVATNAAFSGSLETGETLTGAYDYSDNEGDVESGSAYQWYRSDDENGLNKTAITGAAAQTYTTTGNDTGHYLSFEVIPNDGTDAGSAVESNLRGPVYTAPAVMASAPDNITDDAAILYGEVTADGFDSVTGRGFVYNLTGTPTLADDSLSVGDGTGTFSKTVDGLLPNRTYSVRSFAINTADTTYGNEMTFTTGIKTLVLSGDFTAQDRVYDGTTAASVDTESLSLDGLEGDDLVTIDTFDLAFNQADAGENLPVTITGATLAGDDAENYTVTISGSPAATAAITPKELTIAGGFTVNPKTYDGTTTAVINNNSLTLASVVGMEDVTLNQFDLNFPQIDAGNGLIVTVSNPQLAGNDILNYTVTATGAPTVVAGISPRTLTLTNFAANDKTYDGTDTVDGTGFDDDRLADDDLEFSFDAVFDDLNAGNGVVVSYSNIAISGGTDQDNYTIAGNTGSTTADITPRAIAVSADTKTKVYGGNDPQWTYEITSGSLVSGDTFSGQLGRLGIEDVGTYPIGQGTLSAGSNYTIDYTSADFEITVKDLLVEADANQAKVYGETDPDFTFTANGFELGDDEQILSGSLNRQAGEDADVYAIQLGDLSAGNNYQISFTGEEFEILPAELQIAAVEDQQKVYGEDDPQFAWSANGFRFSDNEETVEGDLAREAGEDIGTYEILSGSINAGENYEITYTSATFAITPATLLVSGDEGQWKFEGDADPELSYSADGFAFEDEEILFEGTLERDAGETPGDYPILVGTLTAGDNYLIDFTGAEFSILRTPPVVEHRSPVEDEDRIAIDAIITAEFDHEISIANEGLITLSSSYGDVVALNASADGSTLTLTHGGLVYHTDYTVSIGEGALENVDDIGNEAAAWNFTTIMSAPVAENPSPLDGSTHVGVTDALTLGFSQEVTLADAAGITINSVHGNSPEDVQAEMIDGRLTIKHGGLENLTEYTVAIGPATVENTDGVGNEQFSWSFESIVPVPEPVVLASPANQSGSVALSSIFEWDPVQHAESYEIQVSENASFESIMADADELTELTFTPGEPLSDYQTYFWRVKAANDAGESEWSDVHTFTTIANAPELVFPLMGSENISIAPMPEWHSSYQTTYRVQLADSDDFGSPVADSLTTNRATQITGLDEDAVYYWRVRVETDSTSSAWTDAISFRTRPAASTEDDEQVVDHSVTFGETSNREERVISELDYRMVGLPGNDHHGVEDFFQGKYGREWKVFYENGSDTEYYDEYEQGDDRFLFAPGRGFWVLSTDIVDFDLKITSVKTNARDAYSVPLHPGWNIITNPHRGPVSWSDVKEMNNFSGDAWGYDQRFVLADTLHPVQGYYVYNHPDQPREYLDIPYATMEQRRSDERGKALLLAKATAPMPAINLSATFEKNGRFDTQILYPDLAGTERESDINEDDLRRYYPSLEMSRSGMMLVNDEHLSRGGLLREVSRFDADGTEFELHIKGETGDTFSWDMNLQQMPEETRALIVNRANSKTWLLKHGDESETTLTEPNAVYDLYTGDRDQLEQLQQDLMPKEFALEPNYPNPFNPVTNIRYSLPEQQRVKLEIYDVIGRRVQVLTNDVQQAGWHVVKFDGSRLASGVYLYRLTTDNNVKVRKMTLVK